MLPSERQSSCQNGSRFTIALFVSVGGGAPCSALQESVKVTCSAIGEDVFPCAPEERSVHELPFVPATVHDDTYCVLQITCVVSPLLTSAGETRISPCGDGGGLHAPLVQPHVHDW